MAVLVRPPPWDSVENDDSAGSVRLTVRANSADDEGGPIDVAASHSDPNDPWHQVCCGLCAP